LFPFAVEAGIDAREYWLYTIKEINITLEGYKKRLATRAAMDYKMVDLIGSSVGRLLSKDAKFPSMAEAYPGLIDAGRSKELEEEAKLAKTTAWLYQFAERRNAALSKEVK
jgi:hypothetical protein